MLEDVVTERREVSLPVTREEVREGKTSRQVERRADAEVRRER